MAGVKGQPGTKPKDVASPVPSTGAQGPSADEFAELDALNAEFADLDSMGEGVPGGDASADFTIPEAQPEAGVMDTVARGLDYAGGHVRTALATAAGMAQNAVQGKNPLEQQVTTDADIKAAMKGKAPGAAEYLKRLGVSEGGGFDTPLGRMSLRGAEGLAIDILTDPLTLIAKAIKGAPYIAKLLETPGKASEALGEAVYKSAIMAKDKNAAKTAGKALIELGAPTGGKAALEQKIMDAGRTMGNIRQGLYDQFNQLGGKIDVTESTFKNARGVLNTLRKDPVLVPLANDLEEMVAKYTSQGFADIGTVSQWKTNLYDSIPKSAWNGVKMSNPGKAFKAALAADFKNLIVDSGNKVQKGLGDAINHVNDKWGALLEAKPVKDPMSGSLGKAIDGAVLAFGGIPGLMKKKALEVAIGPHGRTISGKALMQAGKTDFMNRLARQAIAGSQTAKPDAPVMMAPPEGSSPDPMQPPDSAEYAGIQ